MAKPPVIVNEKGDVELYESVEAAEIDVEAIDVENQEYVIYDSQGLVLIPKVMEDGIHVRLFDSEPRDERTDELVTVLRRKLSQLGEEKTGVPEETVWRMSRAELLDCLQRIKVKHQRRRVWPWKRS